MPGLLLLVGSLLVFGPQKEADSADATTALVATLGSTKYSERESASKALVEQGRTSLRALSLARKANDPEVQARAEYLLERIERSLLVRPTLVKLPPGEQPIADVLRTIREQTGFRFEIDPGADPTWIQNRVQLENREPENFWDLLTTLKLAGNWVQDHESPVFGVRGEPVFHLGPVPKQAPLDRTTSGPLCLVVKSYEGENAPRRRAGGNAFPTDPPPTIRLEILTEPRIVLRSITDVRILEAVDSTGANLVQADQAVFIDGPPSNFAMPGTANVVWPFGLALKRPAGTNPMIRSLVLELDAEIESRRYEPYELIMNRADGNMEFPTPAQCGELSIQRASLIKNPGENGLSLDLVARTEGWSEMAVFRRGNRRRVDLMNTELERIVANLEVADSKGRPFRFSTNQSKRFDPLEFRVTLGLVDSAENDAPTTLRFYGNIRDTAHFRFEFHDLVLPVRE